MKKLLLFTALCFLSLMSMAQETTNHDLIVTFDNQIQCKIFEITDDVIKYHRLDNDAISFTIAKSKVRLIIYANGQIEEISTITETKKENLTATKPAVADSIVYAKDGKYSYRGDLYSHNEVLNLLTPYQPAYQQWKSGRDCYIAGCVFVGLAAVDVIGIVAGKVSHNQALVYSSVSEMLTFSIISGICFGVSPAKKRNALDLWNTEVSRTQTAQLEFGISADENGIGLAIRF